MDRAQSNVLFQIIILNFCGFFLNQPFPRDLHSAWHMVDNNFCYLCLLSKITAARITHVILLKPHELNLTGINVLILLRGKMNWFAQTLSANETILKQVFEL